uniref:Uncharacterized protein n=1 Tax=Heterorhabditis bacteriophora TaxID=37862 RepID=A0A1I7X188_HETBA
MHIIYIYTLQISALFNEEGMLAEQRFQRIRLARLEYCVSMTIMCARKSLCDADSCHLEPAVNWTVHSQADKEFNA